MENKKPSLAEMVAGVEKWESSAGKSLKPLSIAFLRNFTIEPIEPFLKYRALQLGLRLELSFGGYGSAQQELLDPSSFLRKDSPAVVVAAFTLDMLDPTYTNPGWTGTLAIEQLSSLYSGLAKQVKAPIVVNTFIPPFLNVDGFASGPQPSIVEEVEKINVWIHDFARKQAGHFFVADWNRLARLCGEEQTIDTRFAYMSKAPFKGPFLDQYALEIFRVIGALAGKTKKAVVLDCDNTLWGGIIGEDGMNGIKLDPIEAPGKIYWDFQRSLLHLAERGILLTICSKNNTNDVWEVLDNHKNSLLKKSHIAASRINWEDKTKSIVALAKELNLGLDAFVFIDDDATECELVKSMLPAVQVLQVPKNVGSLPSLLFRECLFDTLTLSQEDLKRTQMIQSDQERKAQESAFPTVDAYLESLQLVAVIHEMKDDELSRVAQLTQKTNQFNLTTRRYSEQQIKEIAGSKQSVVFTLRVEDKFGDQGLTGVLVAVKEGETARIDSLLLSCRVLGRRIETAFSSHVLGMLKDKWKIPMVTAGFIASEKNQQTKDFWEKIGFKVAKESPTERQYSLNFKEWKAPTIPFIKIKS